MPEPQSDAHPPQAIIFDLDGTLVDTVETRIQAWLAVFAETGIPASHDQVAPLIGSDGRRLAREVAAVAGVELEPDRDEEIDRRSGEIYQGINLDPIPLPGVRELLRGAGPARHLVGDRHQFTCRPGNRLRHRT